MHMGMDEHQKVEFTTHAQKTDYAYGWLSLHHSNLLIKCG